MQFKNLIESFSFNMISQLRATYLLFLRIYYMMNNNYNKMISIERKKLCTIIIYIHHNMSNWLVLSHYAVPQI